MEEEHSELAEDAIENLVKNILKYDFNGNCFKIDVCSIDVGKFHIRN